MLVFLSCRKAQDKNIAQAETGEISARESDAHSQQMKEAELQNGHALRAQPPAEYKAAGY
jgi:hypothetical protein